MTVQISPLFNLESSDKAYYGNKAASLSLLHQSGLRVPSGIAISFPKSSASRITLSTSDLIIQACKQVLDIDVNPVAVRSSSTEEDSEEFSFAGQFDTFLGIKSEPELIQALSRCLESFKTKRAVSYRTEFGLKSGKMGIIIQKMVNAQYSGICFTRGYSDENHIIVEAVPGYGDQLVSGRARPEQYVFDRKSLKPIKGNIQNTINSIFTLDLAQEIATRALLAENKFGSSLDLEWAFDSKEIFFLQARPITHLHTYKLQTNLIAAEIERLKAINKTKQTVWTDFSLGDVLPNPSPLVIDAFHQATSTNNGVERAFKALGIPYSPDVNSQPVFEMICGRSFINLTEYLNRIFRYFPIEINPHLKTEIKLKLSLKNFSYRTLFFPFLIITCLVRFCSRFFYQRKELHAYFSEDKVNNLHAEALKERQLDLSKYSNSELLDLFEKYNQKSRTELSYYHLMTDIIALLTQSILRIGLKLVYGSQAGEKERLLTTGLEGNFNIETNLDLCDLANKKLSLDLFLEKYGHRGNPDWDPASPRWREFPPSLKNMIDLLQSQTRRNRAHFNQQVILRKRTEIEFKEKLRKKIWLFPLKGLFLKELTYYQIYSPLREKTQSICFLWVELTRNIILEIARRTNSNDLLFFLNLNEIRSFCSNPQENKFLIEKARTRKRELKLLRAAYVPHIINQHTIESIGRPPKSNPNLVRLEGQTVCNGYVTGRARVVNNLEEAQTLEKDEILVVQFTDPAWTPLFLIAGGLILEQGSTFSHGAIVARELGLPAIVNVANCTSSILTGQIITIDGERGYVLLNQEINRSQELA